MQEHHTGGIHFFSYQRFAEVPNVTNVVSTRVGGRSAPPFDSLNLSFHVGDDPDTVLENRAALCQALGIEPETLTLPEQVHGSEVAVVTAEERGSGAITAKDAVAGADALVTRSRGVPLVITIADCVAISLYDARHNVIGLAHAGWRGTAGRIAEKTVMRMKESCGADPSEIVAGISPSIGRCHYEVGPDVLEAYKREFGGPALDFLQEDMDGTCYLDLWAANEAQLIAAGLARANIAVAEVCTACQPALFYSHRHEAGKTGRMAAVVMMHGQARRSY